AYARAERAFAEGSRPDELVEPATGAIFRMEEAALRPRNSEANALPRQPGHLAYWFGWYAFHPETTLYEGCLKNSPGGR
ncbi:MAG: hypothetical protein ABR576_04415, partial [Thermoanaerobaculia bacterium]